MIQVNRIYLIFNRLVTKKFLVDTSEYKIILFLSFTTSIMLAYQNQDIKILENSFLAIPIEMAENTLCFQFKLLSLPRPPFLVGYGTDGTRCTNQT